VKQNELVWYIMQSPLFKMYRTETCKVSSQYFSSENINQIQCELVKQIKQRTNIEIGHQSEIELFKLMNSVYEEHGQIVRDIRCLNNILLKLAIPNIINGIRMHLTYIKDASSLPTPMERSISTKADMSIDMSSRFIL
jgi:predicted methyltransferase